MANTRASNVLVVDTSAQFSEVLNIRSVKLRATAATASVTIKDPNTSGVVVYEANLAADATEIHDADICLKLKQGAYVTVTNGKAYLFLE